MNKKIQQYLDKYEALGYDEDHLLFACHAAFPTGVTVHMLYQLWANFSVVPGRPKPLDPMVISDFLLSNLVRETSLGVFEIQGSLRRELLALLKSDERFGEDRIRALAYFLYQYIQRSLQERDYDTFRETQYWTAMAVIAPNRAAKEIGNLLSNKIKAEDTGEILRLNKLLEQIGQEEKSFENILHYSRGLRDGLLERPRAATESFNKVMVIGESDRDDQLSLKIPLLKSVVSDEVQFRQAPSLSQRKAQELAEARIEEVLKTGAQRLDLSGIANLIQVPESIKKLTSLQELIASNCDLEVFPDFSDMSSLTSIILRENKLSKLPSTIPATVIDVLDVGQNELVQIDNRWIANANLKLLVLDHNQLQIMPANFLESKEKDQVIKLGNNPWLNLPQPSAFSQALEAAREHWLRIPDAAPCIQLFGLGYQLGETILDVGDGLSSWEKAEQITVQNKLVLHRFALYNYAPSTEVDLQILYFGGENFELITTWSRPEIVESTRPEDFATLLANRSSFTNVVILNVPNSAAYAEALLAVGFPAVIAAPGDLSEAQLFGFQEDFFAALRDGLSVRAAFGRVVEEYGSSGSMEQMSYTSNIQQTESNIGPDPAFLGKLWEIYETEGSRVNWDWQLPDIEAQSMAEEASGTDDLSAWQEEQQKLLSSRSVGDTLEALEPQIRMGTAVYHDLVILSDHQAFLEELIGGSALSSEEQERQRSTLRQYVVNLIRNVNAQDLRDSPSDKGPKENMITLRHNLYTHLRKNKWANLWAELDQRLKPTAVNFDRFFWEWKYQRTEAQWQTDTISLEKTLEFRARNVEALCSFINGISADQLKENMGDLGIGTPLEYFEYGILRLLPKGDFQNILYYIQDKLAATRGLNNQFRAWEERLLDLEKSRQSGRMELEDYERDYEQIIRQWGDFLKEEMSEALLRPDYLAFERGNLQDQLNRLQAQKAFDSTQKNQLERELKLVESLMTETAFAEIDWPSIVECYEPLAENRLLEAAERLLAHTQAIPHRISEQAADLLDRLSLLEKDRSRLSFSEYRKEHSDLTNGLVISIGEVLADAQLPDPRRDSDLQRYLYDQVDHWVKEGQLKQAFAYLREALAPASIGLESIVELSASYYLLEAAQYDEKIDYGAILEQLNQYERYLYEVLEGELDLRHDFVAREQQRLERALEEVSKQGKRKKFDVRKDGDYQRLQEALRFLSKFK